MLSGTVECSHQVVATVVGLHYKRLSHILCGLYVSRNCSEIIVS